MSQELDAKVATLVLGLDGADMLKDEQMFPRHGALPEYTTDPRDDYKVLKHVRETWDYHARYRFSIEMVELMRGRKTAHPIMAYEPGDYSKAALAVKEAA